MKIKKLNLMHRIVLSLLFGFMLTAVSAQSSGPIVTAVYFETAEDVLTSDASKTLAALSERIKGMGDYRLVLSAHTDSRGGTAYNQALAERRAQAVAEFLRTQGVTTDDFTSTALGESQAGNDTNNEDLQQNNRRVDVLVEGWYWNGVGSILDSLNAPLVQQHTIDNATDQLLSGQEGGQFFVPADAFVDANGDPVTGNIEIRLQEAYTLGAMVSMGLTTTSQDRILESGGMFKIDATQNGQELQLRPGVQIGVSVPTDQLQADMALFYSSDHTDPAATIDWEATNQPINNRLPRPGIAPAPFLPSWPAYASKYLLDINEAVEKYCPKRPDIDKPMKPREPNYARIVYRPRGLQKLVTSQARKDELTAELRAERRQSYNESMEKYQQRLIDYDLTMESYRRQRDAFNETLPQRLDENNFYIDEDYPSQFALAQERYEALEAQYEQDMIGYRKYRDRRFAAYEAQLEAMGQAGNRRAVESYVFNINRMGWANIDRFLKMEANTPLLAEEVAAPAGEDAIVFVMFPRRNIVLRMKKIEDAVYQIGRSPAGEEAKIIAVKVANQQAYIAESTFTVAPNTKVALTYAPGRLRDIRAAIDAI